MLKNKHSSEKHHLEMSWLNWEPTNKPLISVTFEVFPLKWEFSNKYLISVTWEVSIWFKSHLLPINSDSNAVLSGYSDWCNGEVYGYIVKGLDKKGQEVNCDACWGFVGNDYAQQEKKSIVEYYVNKECDYFATLSSINNYQIIYFVWFSDFSVLVVK